jgi:hypothetical protein
MKCNNCGVKNELNNNYCFSCGIKIDKIKKCDVCYEEKEFMVLGCGHSFCKDCINIIYFSINNVCPTCRCEINKCLDCGSYRVKDMECLDCLELEKKEIHICNYCYSNDLTIHSSYTKIEYSCNHCSNNKLTPYLIPFFHKDRYPTKSLDEVNKMFLKLCKHCNSHNLKADKYKYFCLNCKKVSYDYKKIKREDLVNFTLKSREAVNPIKINVCEECNSREVEYIKNQYYEGFNCNNCKKIDVEIKNINLTQYKEKDVIMREQANPKSLICCKKCNSNNIYFKNKKKELGVVCNSCGNDDKDVKIIFFNLFLNV